MCKRFINTMTLKMKKCSILFPRRNDLDDSSGCLLNDDNHEEHICIDKYGRFFAWSEDLECQCGCIDEMIENDESPCMLCEELDPFRLNIELDRFYADTLKGTKGQFVKLFKDNNHTIWINLYFGRNLTNQKLQKSFPIDCLTITR